MIDTERFRSIAKQAYLVEDGQVGDCWRCCVAAIIGRPAEEVPHFLLESGSSWEANTQRWLNACGWALVYARGGEGVQFPGWATDPFRALPVISCGPTVRSKRRGQHHAVVTFEGETLYDPHPSGAGLLAVTDTYLVVRITP